MSKLELSARRQGPGVNNHYTVISVIEGNISAGILTVSTEHAAEVLGIINSGTNLVEACQAAALQLLFADGPPNDDTEKNREKVLTLLTDALYKYNPEVPA